MPVRLGPRRQSGAASRPGQLTFLQGARRLRATVAARELFHAAGCVHELLFTGKKRMTSSADTDLNVATRRARVVNGAAGADDIGLVIFRMNVRFHGCKRARNLPVEAILRKG